MSTFLWPEHPYNQADSRHVLSQNDNSTCQDAHTSISSTKYDCCDSRFVSYETLLIMATDALSSPRTLQPHHHLICVSFHRAPSQRPTDFCLVPHLSGPDLRCLPNSAHSSASSLLCYSIILGNTDTSSNPACILGHPRAIITRIKDGMNKVNQELNKERNSF